MCKGDTPNRRKGKEEAVLLDRQFLSLYSGKNLLNQHRFYSVKVVVTNELSKSVL